VDDAALVSLLERLGHLARRVERVVERQRPALEPRREVLAFDELEHEDGTPSASSNPWIAAMFAWLSAASSCASRLKRASRSGSAATACDRNLSATSRPSRVSFARQTSPMPPVSPPYPAGLSSCARPSGVLTAHRVDP
jgi:hypothetical protein